MTDPNLRRLDLNLILSLEALLRVRSVSHAAGELGVSQPVMSASLARLRRYFDDPLLVRSGRTYELSPLAVQLRPTVLDALASLERVVSARKQFDPDEEFEISIVCGEALACLLGPEIGRLMRRGAPRCRLRLREPSAVAGASIDNALGNGTVDGLIRPHILDSDMERIDLLEDQWVLAVAEDDPAEELSMADLQARPWLVARLPNGDYHRGMHALVAAGVRPRIDVEVSASMAMPFFLRGTDRVAVIGRRLITDLGPVMGVKEVAGPIALGQLRHAFWWHPNRRHDPVHQWLRSVIVEAAATLNGPAET